MYGEGWTFKNGRGGLSGGGGANGEWIWGDIADPGDKDYTYDCEGEILSYLGMLYNEETDGDEYAYEILMQRKTTPSIGRFSTYSDPAILDYDEDETGSLETEEYTHLPVPENSWDSGEIVYKSAYTAITPSYTYDTLEIFFDNATYYSRYWCDGGQVYPHDIVLATRGQDYLDDLSGDYEGTIRIWSYWYQRTRIEESDFPGIIIPGSGGYFPGFTGHVGEVRGYFNLPLLNGPRIRRFPKV